MIYVVKVPYSGYSRGELIYEVEAESEEEAIYNTSHSDLVSDKVCRDILDIDHDNASAVCK